MATDKKTLAMKRLLKKLSAMRKTLRKDERSGTYVVEGFVG